MPLTMEEVNDLFRQRYEVERENERLRAEARAAPMKSAEPACGYWVSVDDRLPSDEGPKLIYAPSAGDPDKPLTMIAWFSREEAGRPRWHGVLPAFTVTHWMPLPAPPNAPRAATADQTHSAADPA